MVNPITITKENFMNMVEMHLVLYAKDYARGHFTEQELIDTMKNDPMLQIFDTDYIAAGIIKRLGKSIKDRRFSVA